MITHHTVGGCNLVAGDILGTGTVSGPERHQWASMVESKDLPPYELPNGEKRQYLEDGDKLKLSGVARGKDYSIGLGEVTGEILPMLDDSFYF